MTPPGPADYDDDGTGLAPGGSSAYDSGEIEFDDEEFASLGLVAQGAVDLEEANLIATREPSELVRQYLMPTEKFRGEWRRHPIQLARRLSIGIAATIILGFLSGYFAKLQVASALVILLVLWLVVMGWVFLDVIEWYYDRFILTNRRVMLIGGIVARRVAMLPLTKVTDMKYTQSPLGRFLGYGTFEIESAGQVQALRKVDNLPNPTDLYLQVVEEMYEPEAAEARRRSAKIDDPR